MKKLFVVLEQGNKINTFLSQKHKKQFNTEYSDCFRLNWKADKNDKFADYYQDNIVWSEGRSLLFEKVKGMYQYYVFIDDDVDFISKTTKSVSEELKYFFETYNPLTGTIYGDNWAWRLYNNIIIRDKKEVFNIMGHDLCCHYFQEDFANFMFPVSYHGSEKSMWYAQFIAHRLFPNKCIVYNKIHILNTEHIPHHDSLNRQYIGGDNLVVLFSKLFKNEMDKKLFLNWNINRPTHYIQYMNKQAYKYPICKRKITFDKNILEKILDLNSNDYKHRLPIVKDEKNNTIYS